MVLVQKNVAHPWMCDVLGHMTTRHYIAMFDDAAYHMLYTVFGWIGASDAENKICLLYTSPSPRDYAASRMPSSA